ncbi:MAG: IS4 family transposase [Gemmataceae bacterium]
MACQRRERFETEPGQKVLDRLTGLSQFIPDDLLQQAADRADVPDRRDTVLTSEIMLWVVLAMGPLTDLPLRQVFKHARRLRPGESTPPRSSLCVARQRLGVAPSRHLFNHLVRPLATPDTPGAFYKDLRLMAFDSTVLDLPDSPDNARIFGKPESGRAEAAFPQVRKLSLVELGTHVELAIALKPCRRGETTMVPALLRHLQPGMLLLCDRGFFSYTLWKSLTDRKIDALVRVKKRMVLKPVSVLSGGSYPGQGLPKFQAP